MIEAQFRDSNLNYADLVNRTDFKKSKVLN